jgi:hypothetical protein
VEHGWSADDLTVDSGEEKLTQAPKVALRWEDGRCWWDEAAHQ